MKSVSPPTLYYENLKHKVKVDIVQWTLTWPPPRVYDYHFTVSALTQTFSSLHPSFHSSVHPLVPALWFPVQDTTVTMTKNIRQASSSATEAQREVALAKRKEVCWFIELSVPRVMASGMTVSRGLQCQESLFCHLSSALPWLTSSLGTFAPCGSTSGPAITAPFSHPCQKSHPNSPDLVNAWWWPSFNKCGSPAHSWSPVQLHGWRE